MNIHRTVLTLLLATTIQSMVLAQQPTLYFDFEPAGSELIKKPVSADEAVYVVDLQKPRYATGIKGKALDLSEDAMLRTPLRLDSSIASDYMSNRSWSIQLWVKTKPGAILGTPIAGNLTSDYLGKSGWQIRTQSNGAWALYVSDGKAVHEYIPTAQRQRINDGKWHQIAFSYNRKREELWMYFDGLNVAIYNTSGLGNLESKSATVIGGADEKWEYGSGGQWFAFNGYIDEAKIWDQAIDAATIFDLYQQLRPLEVGVRQILPSQIKVMAWNIWHGGHRYGDAVGLQRTIRLIKESDADIVGLIETYGSGEEIADSLGYYFYLISSNLSIMSRFPIIETIKAFKPFNFGGARLRLADGQELVFLNTWLHYLPSYSTSIKEGKSVEFIIAEEGKTRHDEIQNILQEVKPILSNSDQTPVIMSGDFNSGSHLDWTEQTKEIHFDYIIEWPVSKEMTDAGFKDSYRELHVNALLDPGLTWTPRAATSSDKYGLRDRIDYIYYQGTKLQAIQSKVLDYHPVMFPSDHAGVITVFEFK